MTNLDAVFRYGTHPSEAVVLALSGAREVYGIRRIQLKEDAKTIRVEYDATRLNHAIVGQLLRRAGINIAEELTLIPPQPVPPAETAPSPAK